MAGKGVVAEVRQTVFGIDFGRHSVARWLSKALPSAGQLNLVVRAAIGVALAGYLLAEGARQAAATPQEESRIHPSLTAEIPPFPPRLGARRFAIFDHSYSPHPRLLYLLVPDQFAGPDPGDVTRVWGLNPLVHYPDMTGLRNPKNAGKLGVCAGGCPGEMLISIYNRIGEPRSVATLSYDWLEKEIHDPATPAFIKFTKEPNIYHFTDIIRRVINNNPNDIVNQLYFIRKSLNNKVNYFARCSYNTVVHLCQITADLQAYHGVQVDYTQHLDQMPQWQEIEDTVFAFVTRMIVGEYDLGR